jgi:hypothetical protein
LEPADTALEHNFLTVLYPTSSETTAMPATTLVTGARMAGAHIADPDLNRVTLFSSASDGSPPSGTLSYGYVPTAPTLNLLFDLTPGARYLLTTALDSGVQTVTLVPDAGGPYQVSSQGVLSFTLQSTGGPAPTPTATRSAPDLTRHAYLPLVVANSRRPSDPAMPTGTPTATPTATSGSPPAPTPTPTGTITAADLFVDDDNTTAIEPNPNGDRVNMGLYGNTAEASKSSVASH